MKLDLRQSTLCFLSILGSLLCLLSCHKNESNIKPLMNKISEFEQIPDRPSLNFIPLNSAEELTLNGSINNSPQNLTIDSAFQTSQSLRIGGCGSSFSGNNSGTGYYRYPIDTINAASTVEGSLITVTVNAL